LSAFQISYIVLVCGLYSLHHKTCDFRWRFNFAG